MVDMDRFRSQIEAFREVRPVYEAFREVLSAVLQQVARDLGILAIVETRTKTIPSFAEKIVRKTRHADPVSQLTDLCGGRVITQSCDEIEPVCDFIRKHFVIDEANSEDVVQRLGVAEFSYRSVHLIVSLRPGEFREVLDALVKAKPEEERERFERALSRLPEVRSPADCQGSGLQPGPRFKAEIQVRTLLQHAWALFTHDRMYKSEFKVPPRWQRDTNRIAATLEEADEAFVRIIRGVESYRTYLGSYMSREARQEERTKLEAVSQVDPGNRHLAQRIARLSLSLGEWPRAARALEPFVSAWEASPRGAAFIQASEALRQVDDDPESVELARRIDLERLRDSTMAGILLDYGLALWRNGAPEGRRYLERVLALNPADVEGYVMLAETYVEEKDLDAALVSYQRAFKVQPSDPRALGGFVRCKLLLDRDLRVVSLVRPNLEAAITRCRERVRAGVYLPQAFYDIGLFALLLDRPYDALTAYAAAVRLSDAPSAIDAASAAVEDLERALNGGAGRSTHLPELTWVARFLNVVRTARQARQPPEAGGAQPAASRPAPRARQCPQFHDPVVFVIGGHDKSVEMQMQWYRRLFEVAFDGFRGTIIAGGTDTGVSGLVGSLQPAGTEGVARVTYLPRSIPTWTKVHPGYEVFLTDGDGFTALESIQAWTDLLDAGVSPAGVRVLGINGGQISAFDYRMALALGATVGVVRDSGRAANEIVTDEDWRGEPRLMVLPADAQTIRVFVQGIPPSRILAPDHREDLAQQIHEEYLRNQMGPRRLVNPSLAPWPELSEPLKESNRSQIDHLEEKLRAVGLGLRRLEEGRPPLEVDFEEERFGAAVEVMAEMEHGRWNAERVLAGWTLGEKNVEARRSPYLVPWCELPGEVQEWDRRAVRAIPKVLARLGYEIVTG